MLALLAALFSCSCRAGPEPGKDETAWVVVRTGRSGDIDLARPRFAPGRAVREATHTGSELLLGVAPRLTSGVLRIEVAGACPLVLPEKQLVAGKTLRIELQPLLDFGGPYADVGFDTQLTVNVKANCAEARNLSIRWRQISGKPLPRLASENAGYQLRIKTRPAEPTLGTWPAWGIVPISPATRGQAVLEAEWRTPGADNASQVQVPVAAASRSRGLPNVSVGARTLLAGSGWRIAERPPLSRASITSHGSLAGLVPDVSGTFKLEDGSGQVLTLRSGRYDQTPLDCGRSDCHRELAAAAHKSPMTSILARQLAAPHDRQYPDCALGCHAVSEPGLDDGGFAHTASELGLSVKQISALAWDDLPAALRRLGGVGCFACHGPGAIPEASARWSILRSDVCAFCHDAPPRYGHVAAFRSSRMAHSDAEPSTRADPACARCHTTAGFLIAQKALGEARAAPDSVGPLGIGCAACHAPHEHSQGASAPAAPALLRQSLLPELFADLTVTDKARSCVSCHAPGPSDVAASAAAIWAGRGGLEPESGAPLLGPAPHVAIEGGCIGCHRAGPSKLARGAGHAFRAEKSCAPCHDQRSAGQRPDVLERATRLWQRLLARGAIKVDKATLQRAGSGPREQQDSVTGPPHAERPAIDRRSPLGRAALDVLLVLEDPAAAEHNLPYALRLLDAADKTIDEPGSQRKVSR